MSDVRIEHTRLGEVEVIRVVEWQGAYLPSAEMFPTAPAGLWEENAEWLVPDHWRRGEDRIVVALQSWVLRGGGQTIVIDTGVGHDRDRPGMGPFHRGRSRLLALLGEAGVPPESVDFVVNTHLHVDHVGWNTVDAGGDWVPSFPHATYLIPAADDAHYGHAQEHGHRLRPADRLVYEDSVAPVHRAGQSLLWEGTHTVNDFLTLESAPGHTPGSSVAWLRSGGDRAVFVGDLVHSPVQILAPCHHSNSCLDPERAARSRRRVLARAADERALLVPGHFGGPGALEVSRAGGGFALGAWAAFGPGAC
ncbi:MBL fold metallo-hydrolase [Streptomyces californicus]|uniref:MBL fold metallo-hydrolase n=1 Tax=Streptomyces californicus TaxID=67351 RepID=UPI001E64DF78|nr:MBL fold metallo-hydrolase [Streptomyces californicus]MCC0574615.1 MBL fold metallo-hydrolase [Streptomyces californicus]